MLATAICTAAAAATWKQAISFWPALQLHCANFCPLVI
jgi:hypothetical protein